MYCVLLAGLGGRSDARGQPHLQKTKMKISPNRVNYGITEKLRTRLMKCLDDSIVECAGASSTLSCPPNIKSTTTFRKRFDDYLLLSTILK